MAAHDTSPGPLIVPFRKPGRCERRRPGRGESAQFAQMPDGRLQPATILFSFSKFILAIGAIPAGGGVETAANPATPRVPPLSRPDPATPAREVVFRGSRPRQSAVSDVSVEAVAFSSFLSILSEGRREFSSILSILSGVQSSMGGVSGVLDVCVMPSRGARQVARVYGRQEDHSGRRRARAGPPFPQFPHFRRYIGCGRITRAASSGGGGAIRAIPAFPQAHGRRPDHPGDVKRGRGCHSRNSRISAGALAVAGSPGRRRAATEVPFAQFPLFRRCIG